MKIIIVAGARPNFMKIAPIIEAIERRQKSPSFAKAMEGKEDRRQEKENKNIQYRLVHTGQHYDTNMSESFFRELNIPDPDVNLNCGGGSQAEQTAAIMVAFEKELIANPADLVMVVGDVTSTMACSIVAKKLNTKVAHIEAGIRSFDMTMPEEINRMVTDCLTDYFFTTSDTANQNLRKTGVPEEKIFFVGNVMIDTLLSNRHKFLKPAIWDELKLTEKNYIVLTLHRPANVDNPTHLRALLQAIVESSRGLPVIFPVHPRTARIIKSISHSVPGFRSAEYRRFAPQSLSLLVTQSLSLIQPLGYLEFNYLVECAKVVITDSGGITEETTVLGVPCITIRDSTERPETVNIGTNELIGTDCGAIKSVMDILFAGKWKKGGVPELWDGMAAQRIVNELLLLSA